MEKLEKEKKFDELIKKFSWFDDHVNNLADAMMHVAMIANTHETEGNCVRPAWIQDVLTGLALARLDLQEMFELREDYANSKDVPDSVEKEAECDRGSLGAHQLQQEITATNSRFGEILNVLCSKDTIDDGAILDWMRKSIADARILLNRLSDDSSTD